jgi:hypothetical protein
MKIEFNNYRLRFDLSLKRLVEVTGINSNTDDTMQTHILLWDFDNQTLDNVTTSLSKIQDVWCLPEIHIIKSSGLNRFHAYCFAEFHKPMVLHILSETPFICDTFFKLGVMRGYWTLRITPKRQSEGFTPIRILPSNVRPDVKTLKKLQTVIYKTELH